MPRHWVSLKLLCHLMELEPRRLQLRAAELKRNRAVKLCVAKTSRCNESNCQPKPSLHLCCLFYLCFLILFCFHSPLSVCRFYASNKTQYTPRTHVLQKNVKLADIQGWLFLHDLVESCRRRKGSSMLFSTLTNTNRYLFSLLIKTLCWEWFHLIARKITSDFIMSWLGKKPSVSVAFILLHQFCHRP